MSTMSSPPLQIENLWIATRVHPMKSATQRSQAGHDRDRVVTVGFVQRFPWAKRTRRDVVSKQMLKMPGLLTVTHLGRRLA